MQLRVFIVGFLALFHAAVDAQTVRLVGCFKDDAAAPAFGTNASLMFTYLFINSAPNCVEFCRRKDVRYAGCQEAKTCYCGDSGFDKYGEVDVTECGDYGYYDPNHSCGDVLRNSVYDTQVGFMAVIRQMECYKDTVAGIFENTSAQMGADNNNFRCSEYCNSRGRIYSETHGTAGCKCSNFPGQTFDSRPWASQGQVDSSQCGAKCQYDDLFPKDRCGGPGGTYKFVMSHGYYNYGCHKATLEDGVNGVIRAWTQGDPENVSGFRCAYDCCVGGINGVFIIKSKSHVWTSHGTCGKQNVYKQAAIGGGQCFCTDEFIALEDKVTCAQRCTAQFEKHHWCGGDNESNIFAIVGPSHILTDCTSDWCSNRGDCVPTNDSVQGRTCLCQYGYCGNRCEYEIETEFLRSSNGRRLTVNWSTTMMLMMCAVWFVSAARCRLLTTWRMN